MKAERSPLKSSLLRITPKRTMMKSEKNTNPQMTHMASLPKKAGAKKATTAIRAVHGTNGASKMVNRRDFHESITRVPITAGTLQPKPRKSGKKDLPCSPIQCIKLSMTYAARAM